MCHLPNLSCRSQLGIWGLFLFPVSPVCSAALCFGPCLTPDLPKSWEGAGKGRGAQGKSKSSLGLLKDRRGAGEERRAPGHCPCGAGGPSVPPILHLDVLGGQRCQDLGLEWGTALERGLWDVRVRGRAEGGEEEGGGGVGAGREQGTLGDQGGLQVTREGLQVTREGS